MKTKKLFLAGIASAMLLALPQATFADHINLDDRAQMSWRDCTKSRGNVKLESGKILNKDQGGDLTKISESYSVFNQFTYYRGQDFYTGTSGGATFAYDTKQSIYGAKLADGKYFYGVYNKDNDKNDFKVDFYAGFDSNLQKLIKKGDLEVAVVAEASNYNGSTNKQRAMANLRFYNKNAPIQQEITTQKDNYDGWRVVSAGWEKPNSDITRMIMNLRSERNKFTRTFNKSYIKKVKVYLRDTAGPKTSSYKIMSNGFSSLKNINNETVYAARVGSTIRYEVTFDENIKVDEDNKDKVKLLLTTAQASDSSKAEFYATYDGVSGDKIKFKYTVPDNTNNQYELKVTADVSKLEGTEYITDIAGNAYESGGSFTFNKTYSMQAVDDRYPRFASTALGQDKPYPTVKKGGSKADKACNAYGSVPDDIFTSGSTAAQPIIFSNTSSKKPVFRIVLDDEIYSGCLKEGTKLKMYAYDTSKNRIGEVYAKLVGANITGVTKDNAKGIKYGARTTMYFQYDPVAISGHSTYMLDFAGTYTSEKFTFDDNAITDSAGNKIKNIAGLEVKGQYLVVPSSNYDLLPLQIGVTIDTQAPTLEENKISSEWAKEFNNNAKLVFSDDVDFGTDGAKISLVYYDNGQKKYITSYQTETGIVSYDTVTVPTSVASTGTGKTATVDLTSVKLRAGVEAIHPIYLEYTIKDKAGNIATNVDKNNIEVRLDNIPPTATVDKSKITNVKGNVTIPYDVKDKGVGTINPMIEYVLKNYSDNKEENMKTSSTTHEVTVTGNEGKLDNWEVWAKFSDTVGNKMAKSVSSGPFSTALRALVLSFNDSADSVVSDKHVVKADISKLPTSDATFKIKYGWKRGASASASDAKTEITFDSAADFGKFDFASEEVQKKYNNGNLFDGEFSLFINVHLVEDDKIQNHAQTFYFDVKNPEGTIRVEKEREGVNRAYDIVYELYDDASQYKNGAYVKNNNIDFSEGKEPKLNLYIDGKLAKTYSLTTFKSMHSIDFKNEFGGKEEYENATTAKAEIVFEDKFGHSSKIESEEMRIDLKAPEVVAIKVDGENILTRGEDLYIINGIEDIKSISALFDDETADGVVDKLDVYCGNEIVPTRTDKYEMTINNLVDDDFRTFYRDYDTKEYEFYVQDMGGNSTWRTVSFIVDGKAPNIYSTDLSEISKKTNADYVFVHMDYGTESYETRADMKITVEGAELVNDNEVGSFDLKISQNGTVKVQICDITGKKTEKSFKVNCFDREAPVISLGDEKQTPETGASKYGSITMTASDNESLTVLEAAIIPKSQEKPNNNDFFSDSAETRTISENEDGEDDEVVTEEGYFGANAKDAYAKLNPAPITLNYGGNVSAAYKITYGAIPDGYYSVYAKVSDNAGNVTIQKLTDIQTTDAAASAETEYTPSSENPTGGEVTAKISTDIRTQLLYNGDLENFEAMLKNAEEKRKNGFTYSYGGVTTTLTFDEAYAKYKEIAKKYMENESDLTDEDRYLLKYKPDIWDSSQYSEYLNNDQYTEPVGDILDYLLNECLYGSTVSYTDYTLDITTDYEVEAELTMEDATYEEVINPILYSKILNKIYKSEDEANGDAGGDTMNPDSTSGPSHEGLCYRVQLNRYPEAIDTYVVDISLDKNELELGEQEPDVSVPNPFRDKYFISTGEVYELFGDDFDLSLLIPVADGFYQNPFGEDMYLYVEEIDETLKGYMSEYIEDNTVYYKNPFDDKYGQELTYNDIKAAVQAIPKLQNLREQAVIKFADKYVRSYMSLNGSEFSTEHIMTFAENMTRTYTLLDELGRKTDLPISIDWIDHTRPYVPKDNIIFKVDGEPFTKKFTNAESGVLEVNIPTEGIFAEYRLANLPAGADATSTEATADGVELYTGFTLEVSDNQTVEFDVLNPTSSETEFSRQSYVINCFDRNEPTYELIYSPQKPSSGVNVNKDVTVTLTDIEDDRSAANMITVSETSHTFTENGDYTFEITDEAGNKVTVPVTVDYIDKNPTDLNVEFESEGEYIEDSEFNRDKDYSDYRNVNRTYEYKNTSPYLKSDVMVTISYKNEVVQSFDIGDDEEYSYTYTASNGSKGTVSIKGIKFDKQAPTAEVSYDYTEAKGNYKDYVTANIILADNISSNVSLVSVSGRDNTGKTFTEADVKDISGGRSVRFDNNGFAKLVFKDDAGNTTEVSLNVSNLDRTIPRAFISYSSQNKTNSDVVANIKLNKLADYQVYSEGDTLLKDYTGAFSANISYTFEDNGTRVFKFKDMSGNETEGLLATVNNIDKVKPELSATIENNKMATENGTLEYYPGAATIVLEVKSDGDVLDGGENDTIFIQNASQSKYHSVLNNGRYAFRYMDEAGNFDVLYVDVDCIDTTQPTATDSGNPTSWTNVPPTITITPNQKANGIKTYIYQNGTNLNSTSINPTENGVYSFTVRDEIGNSSTHRVNVEYVDTEYPEIKINEGNAYKGNKDIFINAGEFDQNAFEDVTASDGVSGLAADKPTVDYTTGGFDQNTPGKYPVYFKISDNAGNETVMTRTILVMGPDDVYPAINDTLAIPGSQMNYLIGDELKLSFINADTAGNKVSYAFVKGYYNGAQMKGKEFKALAAPNDVITLEAKETGMYTLFVQTENRNVMVMYVFIAG